MSRAEEIQEEIDKLVKEKEEAEIDEQEAASQVNLLASEIEGKESELEASLEMVGTDEEPEPEAEVEL